MQGPGSPASARHAVALHTFRRFAFVMVLLLPGSTLAASIACTQANELHPPAADKALEVLDEVVVTPGKTTSRTRDLGAWLKRLEGQYSYEGYVDPCGSGLTAQLLPVAGKSDCVSLYSRGSEHLPSLYCVVNVRWPQAYDGNGAPVMGSEPNLSTAMVVYGVVPDLPGIQFTQIDSRGIATHAQGKLAGHTLTAVEKCNLPGTCRKMTRITARPDSNEITMLIDVEVDSRRVLRLAFLLHRMSNIQMRNVENTLVTRDDLPSVGQR